MILFMTGDSFNILIKLETAHFRHLCLFWYFFKISLVFRYKLMTDFTDSQLLCWHFQRVWSLYKTNNCFFFCSLRTKGLAVCGRDYICVLMFVQEKNVAALYSKAWFKRVHESHLEHHFCKTFWCRSAD